MKYLKLFENFKINEDFEGIDDSKRKAGWDYDHIRRYNLLNGSDINRHAKSCRIKLSKEDRDRVVKIVRDRYYRNNGNFAYRAEEDGSIILSDTLEHIHHLIDEIANKTKGEIIYSDGHNSSRNSRQKGKMDVNDWEIYPIADAKTIIEEVIDKKYSVEEDGSIILSTTLERINWLISEIANKTKGEIIYSNGYNSDRNRWQSGKMDVKEWEIYPIADAKTIINEEFEGIDDSKRKAGWDYGYISRYNLINGSDINRHAKSCRIKLSKEDKDRVEKIVSDWYKGLAK